MQLEDDGFSRRYFSVQVGQGGEVVVAMLTYSLGGDSGRRCGIVSRGTEFELGYPRDVLDLEELCVQIAQYRSGLIGSLHHGSLRPVLPEAAIQSDGIPSGFMVSVFASAKMMVLELMSALDRVLGLPASNKSAPSS